MIDHSACEHERSPKARAKCRREKSGATPKDVDFTSTPSPRERKPKERKGAPRDKSAECRVCGIEPIAWRGTDPLTGVLLYVGKDCEYYIRHSPDKEKAKP